MNLTSQKLLLLTLTFILSSMSVTFSQEKKIKKANEEFDRFAYIDAREIYLKVVQDGYASAEIFKKLGDTYYWNSDYDNAAKWYGRLVDQFPAVTEPAYFLRAAQSYKSLGDYDKSDALMEKYTSMTGDNIISDTFESNKDYLGQIAFLSKNYELEKTSISSNTSDFGAAYYQGKIVFASAAGTTGDKTYEWTDQPYLDLFVADRDSLGVLSNKTRMSGKINSDYHESSAVFTKDGNTIYFTRNNLKKGKAKTDKNKTVRLKLYSATKGEDGEWMEPVQLPFNSEEYSTAHPALSLDEKTLYFSSDMPGTYGMSDLWSVEILGDNTFGEPVNLGKNINTEARESFPFVSVKNNLYFATDGRPGLGGYDIYSTSLNNNNTKELLNEVKNVGIPANSNKDDFALIINEDENLGYVSSNRDGDMGSTDDDIYRLQFSKCRVNIAGIVVDKNTNKIIPGATVRLMDTSNQLIEEVIANDKAEFSFPEMDCNKQFLVRASKATYEPVEQVVNTPNETIKLSLVIPLTSVDPCPPNDLGCRLSLQPIYFDFDKSFIRPDAEIELAKILAAMRQYPELIIHIESHTDSRASFAYNERLSERRAQSTLSWLINKGIAPSRLSAKGYGESELVNQCSDGVPCTEEEHQLNRRSMFIIKN